MSVCLKLMQVQSELKAPKGQYNSFGKYKYRSCEDILEAVKPILSKHKAVVTISDAIVVIGERYYVEATATFIDAETGEYQTTTAYAREEESKKGMDGSQVTGASSSYARKYALNGLFCIDDTKDSDSTNTHGKDEKTATDNKPTPQADYCCENCGTPFTDTTYKGKVITAEQQYMSAIQKRGGAYCKKCFDAMKVAQNES